MTAMLTVWLFSPFPTAVVQKTRVIKQTCHCEQLGQVGSGSQLIKALPLDHQKLSGSSAGFGVTKTRQSFCPLWRWITQRALAEKQPGCWRKRAPGGSINISEVIMCENVTLDIWVNYTQNTHRQLQSSHESAVWSHSHFTTAWLRLYLKKIKNHSW